jgi:hypothetical protein
MQLGAFALKCTSGKEVMKNEEILWGCLPDSSRWSLARPHSEESEVKHPLPEVIITDSTYKL